MRILSTFLLLWYTQMVKLSCNLVRLLCDGIKLVTRPRKELLLSSTTKCSNYGMAALLTWQLFLSPAWETCTLFLTKHFGMNLKFLNGTLGSSILQISIKNTKMKGKSPGRKYIQFWLCLLGRKESHQMIKQRRQLV